MNGIATAPHPSTLLMPDIIMVEGLHGIWVVKEFVIGGSVLLQTKDDAKALDFMRSYRELQAIEMANAMDDDKWADHTKLVTLLLDSNPLPWSVCTKDYHVTVSCVSTSQVILPMHEFTAESAYNLVEFANALHGQHLRSQ